MPEANLKINYKSSQGKTKSRNQPNMKNNRFNQPLDTKWSFKQLLNYINKLTMNMVNFKTNQQSKLTLFSKPFWTNKKYDDFSSLTIPKQKMVNNLSTVLHFILSQRSISSHLAQKITNKTAVIFDLKSSKNKNHFKTLSSWRMRKTLTNL